MVKTVNILFVMFLWTIAIQAQNKVMSFDGVNDHINLGSTVATGARTIEMWFNPSINITTASASYYPLIVRDETPNNKEFGLTFMPNSTGFGGQLLFYVHNNSTTSFRIYSNSNTWSSGQWYHVSAVVHPTQGMMLFIDGVKQNSVSNNTISPLQSTTNTNVGTFGNVNNRYFNGKIDNLRLSNTAVYTSNFTPSCSLLSSNNSTIGLYKFDGNSNSPIAIDSSGNLNNGVIFGSTRISESLCEPFNCISFDGVNDYINLGSTVATGARTIEMWFNPGLNITTASARYYPLIVRDETPNNKEFGLTFMPNSTGFGGQLLFYVHNNSTTSFRIYSNSSTWNLGQWYHVAAVVHPTQGMMLFIDGVKQNSVSNNTISPLQSTTNSNVGTFGNVNNRYFNGKIDDLRLSNSALYSVNFTPPCQDIQATSATIAVFNFNDSSNVTIAVDSSGNNNNGIIYGANGVIDTICPPVTTSINVIRKSDTKVLVFPNPMVNEVHFKFSKDETAEIEIILFSIDGKLITKTSGNSSITINTELLSSGMYFYKVIKDGEAIAANKLIKK
jgi:hypothetical protein